MEVRARYACSPGTVRGRGLLLGGSATKGQLLYTNGKNVIVRSLKDPGLCDVYTEHGYAATVARFSPNGEWIASADSAGNVRIWASHTLGCDPVLKAEHRPLSGSVDDMQWSEDGQRIAVCGEGKETRAKCILWDSGNSVGEFDGISKRCNSCDFKPSRPFRIVTGSEDFKTNVYEGPPFKFTKSAAEHTNFVNCVRFSPNGDRFVSVGSDQKGFLYDGKTGDTICELPSGGLKGDGHKGSIYSANWSPDSTQVLTASADKTVKLWDVSGAAPRVITTFTFATKPEVEHMQVGSFWLGDFMGSVSLSGDINYLDPRAGPNPVQTVRGHGKTITALSSAPDNELYSASYDGVVNRWRPSQGCVGRVCGSGHGAGVPVAGVAAGTSVQCTSLLSVGMDDTALITPLPAEQYGTQQVPLAGAPSGGVSLAADGQTAAVATAKGVVLLVGGREVANVLVDYDATSVSISPAGDQVAVGAANMKVYIYEVEGGALRQAAVLEKHRGAVTVVAYSPDGSMLATADANREIVVWDRTTREVKKSKMVFHSARVQCLAWSPSSEMLASGSLDMSIIVWPMGEGARVTHARAHTEGVTQLAFTDAITLVSAGADACLRVWTVAA